MTTLDNQLELLIKLYEEEKTRLQKRIDDCLVEGEYLMADYHLQALYQLGGKLQTLQNIDDKLFDKKIHNQRIIDGLQKSIERKSPDYMKEYILNTLQSTKEELAKLNQIPRETTVTKNSTILDETLNKLMDKKIKNLKLILNKTDNLLLAFNYSKKAFKVTLPHVKQLTKKWILYKDKINAFISLGFELTENETKLTLTLTGDKESILHKLKIVLCKIVFEIFYFKNFENETYIQFTDKVAAN